MAYEYTKLTVADREQIADQQIRQFEGEIFAHELNITRVEALGEEATDADLAAAAKATEDIATIAAAITVTASVADELRPTEGRAQLP